MTYGARVFLIAEGSPFALIDGKQAALVLLPGDAERLALHCKDFGDLLGVQVKWNAGKRTVEVTKAAAAK